MMEKFYAIAIARNPHIQIYEGLTELLGLVARMSNQLEIICPVRSFEDEPLWKPDRVSYSFVQPKNARLGIPTTFKLFVHALVKSLKNPPNIIIGGDRIGNIVAALIHRLLGTPFIYYGLELPCLRLPNITWADKLEHWSIISANMVVTMDDHHATFICAQTGISKNKCVILPNAVSGPLNGRRNDLLRKRFSLQESDVLLLHAGGIGHAQQSLELADMAREWGNRYHLIFHAHCRMDGEQYFQQFANTLQKSQNVHLNNEPVSMEQLDNLVGSADIGIAWYDHDLLGYRAELLGLAAGKIGRYLKNGLPVIARNLPTIKEYLDRYECGICVDRLDEITAAIDTIKNDYERYSKNALRCYEELWKPEPYLQEIQRRIEKIVH
jgi:glycosyltransferase involved in cell wall biosynthesis